MPESKFYSIREFLTLGTFEPARIQRQFSWTGRQAQDLIEDIVDAKRDRRIGSLYLGPLVVLKSPRRSGFATVYDGFHRVVALSILIRLLADQHPSGGEDYVRLIRPDGHPRVIAPTPGRTLTDFLAGRSLAKGPLSDADRNLRSVMQRLKYELDGQTAKSIAAFADFVLNKTHVTVTFMESNRVAFRAFVTANDRGVRLNQGDLLKGYLVDFVETHKKRGGGQGFAQDWTKVQRNLDRSFLDFLKAIHFLVFSEPPGLDFVDQWLEYFEGDRGLDKLTDIVQVRFARLADHFKRFNEVPVAKKVFGDDLQIFRLSLLPWKDWQAPALLLMYDGPEKWPDGLRQLAQACWMIEILELSPERRAKVLAEACDQIQHNRSPFENIGLRDEPNFFGALTFNAHNMESAKQVLVRPVQSPSRVRAIARWLETLNAEPEKLPCFASTIQSASTEHVLPRKPRADWRHWSEDEQQECIHKLGNICLIPASMNHDLENCSDKKKFKAFRTLESKYYSAHEVAESNEWSASIVEERTQRLAERACVLGLGRDPSMQHPN